MGRKEIFLNHLFDIHSEDLQSVFPHFKDMFFCPICFKSFTRDDIASKRLSDGHVWQQDLRRKSAKTSHHHVLLCTKCNNTAGGRGDGQTGLMEKFRDGEETGDLYGKRDVFITQKEGEEPLKAFGQIKRDKTSGAIYLEGELDKFGRFVGSSPQDQQRFTEIATQRLKVANIHIDLPRDLNIHLSKAGWFTAAYLFAFYCLGYRYVCLSALDPVREYIRQSFEIDDESLVPPRIDNCRILEHSDVYFPDPEIGLIIPFNQIQFLRVMFLRYEIRLPFPLINQKILYEQLYIQMPDLVSKIPELIEKDQALYFQIDCPELNGHPQFFDELMKKPVEDSNF